MLAIASRGCPEDCQGFALAAVFTTTLLGSVVVICTGLAAWRWWHGDREAVRSRGLFVTGLVVGGALLAASVLALTGALEDVIEGVLGVSLQPGRWEEHRLYERPPPVTLVEVLAAAYAAGLGALAVAGALWIRGQTRRVGSR